MNFLIDAILSPRVATRLREGGFAVSHVVDVGLGTATDIALTSRPIFYPPTCLGSSTIWRPAPW
jgi:hypothetical protein